MLELTERETKIIAAATMYAERFSDTGLPGHNLLILIDKLNKNFQETISVLLGMQTVDALRRSNDDERS